MATSNIHIYDFSFFSISPRFFQELVNNQFLSTSTSYLSTISIFIAGKSAANIAALVFQYL